MAHNRLVGPRYQRIRSERPLWGRFAFQRDSAQPAEVVYASIGGGRNEGRVPIGRGLHRSVTGGEGDAESGAAGMEALRMTLGRRRVTGEKKT